MKTETIAALEHYRQRMGIPAGPFRAVLFDMDGVLYDSMPGHCKAWKTMCDENGITADADEFFAYEGRTGASTIDLLFRRQYGHGVDADTAKRLYARKSEVFKAMGLPPLMRGARKTVDFVLEAGLLPCLVTGSGQASILERLEADYPEAFPAGRRVTAHDVVHGKPDPEPYHSGMGKCGVEPREAVAIDNAPLGVESAVRAGAFTIGVLTGPLPEGALQAAGADIVVDSMDDCAVLLAELLSIK